jgi:GH3 auxin-responsive promoter
LLPWLVATARRHGVAGRAYLSISPATRPATACAGIPIGLPDGAYLGEPAGTILGELSVMPMEVASITDVARWRALTLYHLKNARDLELISCWSPTFLLRLLDDLGEPRALWPRLKVVSCWTSAASRPFAAELAARLPHAHLQPKGLMSTECVVTVPDAGERPALSPHGFFEFLRDGRLTLADELDDGATYEVVATTASGLYRYRTSDIVRFVGRSAAGHPLLEFLGRGAASSDLVGEKLTEQFVAECLDDVPGFRMLVPTAAGDGYLLATDARVRADVSGVERRLCANPQYAHARRLGQLKALRLFAVERLFDRYVEVELEAGARLGDIKPIALRSERSWPARLGGSL